MTVGTLVSSKDSIFRVCDIYIYNCNYEIVYMPIPIIFPVVS